MNLKNFSELTFYRPCIHEGEDERGRGLSSASMMPSVRGSYVLAGDVRKLISKCSDLEVSVSDLLEALENLLEDDLYADGEGVIPVDKSKFAEAARAAIAKARGEA